MPEALTLEEQAWFNQPVNVEVEQDNSRWLDEMMKMKQDELINYAAFQYGIPEAAAQVVNREQLIQMIVVANKAGGGQSVLRNSYKYLKGLVGVIQPMVTVRGSRPLYLTRGSGNNLQVFDKVKDDWVVYHEVRQSSDQVRQQAKDVTDEMIPNSSVAESVGGQSAVDVRNPETARVVRSLLPKMSREQLNGIAADLKIEHYADEAVYPTNKLLAQAIADSL